MDNSPSTPRWWSHMAPNKWGCGVTAVALSIAALVFSFTVIAPLDFSFSVDDGIRFFSIALTFVILGMWEKYGRRLVRQLRWLARQPMRGVRWFINLDGDPCA